MELNEGLECENETKDQKGRGNIVNERKGKVDTRCGEEEEEGQVAPGLPRDTAISGMLCSLPLL